MQGSPGRRTPCPCDTDTGSPVCVKGVTADGFETPERRAPPAALTKYALFRGPEPGPPTGSQNLVLGVSMPEDLCQVLHLGMQSFGGWVGGGKETQCSLKLKGTNIFLKILSAQFHLQKSQSQLTFKSPTLIHSWL